MTRTNWDGTPRDVAEVRARGLGGDPCTIEVGTHRDMVSYQKIGSRGGLSEMMTLTPDNAREMARALERYAEQLELEVES